MGTRGRGPGRRLVHDRGWALLAEGAVVAWSRPPLVGRRRERHLLTDRLALAGAGRPQAVVVHGEAGVGKTRLALEMEAAAAERSVAVTWLRGLADDGPPFHPLLPTLVPALADLFSIEEAYAADLEVLDGLGSVAEAGPGASVQGWAADAQRREVQALLTLSRLTIEAAQRRARALVVDDAHLLDRATSAFLAQLLHTADQVAAHEPVPLFVLVLARGHRPPPVLSLVADLGCVEVLELVGLNRLEAVDLLGALGVGVDDPRTGAVVDRSGGNPLFLTSVARRLVASGAAGIDAALPSALPASALPSALPAAVQGELVGLELDTVATLADVALWDGGAPRDDLAGLSAVDHAELDRRLRPAAEAGLVEVDAGRVRFTHGARRAAAAASRDEGVTATRHRLLAEHLAADGDEERVLEAAGHLIAARDVVTPDDLAAAMIEAARIGAARGRWADVMRCAEAGLEAMERLEPGAAPVDRLRLRLLLARGALASLDLERARRTAEEARREAASLGDDDAEAEAVLLVARCIVYRGHYRAQVPGSLVADLERVAELEKLPIACRVEARLAASEVAWMAGDAAQAAARADAAHAAAVAAGDDRLASGSLVSRATAAWLELRLEESARLLDEAVRLATRADDPVGRALALGRRALVAWIRGEAADAEERAREALLIAEDGSAALERPLPLAVLAAAAAVAGDRPLAELRGSEALVIVRASGDSWVAPFLLGPTVHLATLAGDSGAALRVLDDLAVFLGPPAGEPVADVFRVWVGAMTGAPHPATDAVLGLVEDGIGQVFPGPSLGVTALVAALVDAADSLDRPLPLGADDAIELALARGQRLGSTLPLSLDRVAAVLARHRGQLAAAEVLARRAVDEAERWGAGVLAARARLELARVRARRGASAEEVQDEVDRVLAAATTLPIAGLVRWASWRPELAPHVEPALAEPGDAGGGVVVAVDLAAHTVLEGGGRGSVYRQLWRETRRSLDRLRAELGGLAADSAETDRSGDPQGVGAVVGRFATVDHGVEFVLRALAAGRRRGLPVGAAVHAPEVGSQNGAEVREARALAGLAGAGEVIVSASAQGPLAATWRLGCDALPPVLLPGRDEPVEIARVRLHDG